MASRNWGCNREIHRLPGTEIYISDIPSCQTHKLPPLFDVEFFKVWCCFCVFPSCFTFSGWVLCGKTVMHGLEGVIVGAAFNAVLQYTLCREVIFTSRIHECT